MSYHHQPALGATEAEVAAAMETYYRQLDPFYNASQAIATGCMGRIATSATQLENARYRVVDQLTSRTFYTTTDFDQMLTAVWALLDKMKDSLDQLRQDDWGSAGAVPMINEERLQIYRRFEESGQYVTYLNEAKSKGIEVIDAPGFWRWVEKSLMEVELATGVIAYVACKKPVWLAVVEWVSKASMALVALVEKAVRVVIAAGKAVLQIPDTLGMIWSALKWGAILGGGAFLVMKIRERRRSGG